MFALYRKVHCQSKSSQVMYVNHIRILIAADAMLQRCAAALVLHLDVASNCKIHIAQRPQSNSSLISQIVAAMDLRSYSLPIHPSYSPYLRVRSGGVEVDPMIPCQRQRRCSTSNLSLSDDPRWEGMRHRGAFSKAQIRSSGSDSRDRDSIKHREPKKHLVTPENGIPRIDLALRNLSQEVNASLVMFKALVRDFESQVEPLQYWAEDYTLDTIWKNKIKDKFRHKRERERFEGAAVRISGSRASVKDSIAKAKALKTAWDDRYEIEGQIRAARKALLYCDGIIDLDERAASERLACKQLVVELEDTKYLLGRKNHAWICRFAAYLTHLSKSQDVACPMESRSWC